MSGTAAPQLHALSPTEHQAGQGSEGPPPGGPSQSLSREAVTAPLSGATFPSLRSRALLWPLISFSTKTVPQYQKAPHLTQELGQSRGLAGYHWLPTRPHCQLPLILLTSPLSNARIPHYISALSILYLLSPRGPPQHLGLAIAMVASGQTLLTTNRQHAPLDCPWEVNKYLLSSGNCGLGACVL